MSTKHYLLLDRSGSMSTNWKETIGAINAYVDGLPAGDTFTLAVFDASITMNYDVLRNNVKVKDFEEIRETEALPRGSTPLFDAVARMANTILDEVQDRATFVIVTDGYENASREMKKDSAKALLDRLRDKGYEVQYIGANFEDMKDAIALGTRADKLASFKPGDYVDSFRSLSAMNATYSSTGQAADLTKVSNAN